MKKYIRVLMYSAYIIFCIFTLSFIHTVYAGTYTISDITISPNFDISYFNSYTFSANISPQPPSASIRLEGINTDGGSDWSYFADGTRANSNLTYDMTFDSGTTWKKTLIRPDHIYPQIFFAPPSITWNNTPSAINIRRQNYHVVHFVNPFKMVDDMNFWIEMNTEAVSPVNSADLLVYLVKKGKTSTFFQSDWRNSDDVELVGSINRNTSFHHEHTDSSSHHLIRLEVNSDKTFGTKHLDIEGDFWLIFYNISPNTQRGWNLKYHASSLCTNANGWYRGNQTGWTITSQAGCPDIHVHFARRSTYIDGVKATITSGDSSENTTFTFASLPNLAPNETNFTNPVRGNWEGTFNITWNAASDPNDGDSVDYNLYLLDDQENPVKTLITSTASTSYSWNTTNPLDPTDDGNYILKGQACDEADLCTDFYSQPFSINNTNELQSLSSITMESNNPDPTIASTNNIVTLSFTASGTITTPTVSFFSGGASTTNIATVSNNTGNNWTAVYTISALDTNGQVTFIITNSDLDLEYTDLTSGSYVTVNIPTPTQTPTPIPSSTPTPTTQPNSSNSSTNSIVLSATKPECNIPKPAGTPDLFQINAYSNKAILFFTPLHTNNSDYYIAYSQKQNAFEHGIKTDIENKRGVLSYTISHLKPDATYYFSIRGDNGCMPGEFSPHMKIKTQRKGASSSVHFYKYTKSNLFPLIKKLLTNSKR